jgi:hypothetical protein
MHFMSWDVGRMIASRQQEEGWGAKVIARLAVDLQNELLEEKGFSPTNLKRMVRFWSEYPGLSAIGARNVRQIAAEYSLRDMEKPIGVADYELTRALPEKLASSLPSIEAIEAELAHQLGETDS